MSDIVLAKRVNGEDVRSLYAHQPQSCLVTAPPLCSPVSQWRTRMALGQDTIQQAGEVPDPAILLQVQFAYSSR